MIKPEIREKYFNWLCNQISASFVKKSDETYTELLRSLFETEFTYILPTDEDRAIDGINLRYIFGDKERADREVIAFKLDTCPCSVLEMMIALSIRCEKSIMDDPDVGTRTGEWFWNMIVNLRLEDMVDGCFNARYVSKVIDRFLKRQYEPNGKGGLFYIDNCYYDLRESGIWYQMMWYLDRYYH